MIKNIAAFFDNYKLKNNTVEYDRNNNQYNYKNGTLYSIQIDDDYFRINYDGLDLCIELPINGYLMKKFSIVENFMDKLCIPPTDTDDTVSDNIDSNTNKKIIEITRSIVPKSVYEPFVHINFTINGNYHVVEINDICSNIETIDMENFFVCLNKKKNLFTFFVLTMKVITIVHVTKVT
jgi:hypothetical protein